MFRYFRVKTEVFRTNKRIRKRKPTLQMKIAKERIKRLFYLAKLNFDKYPERGKKYVELARKIGKRYNVRLTKEEKRSFCKKCNQFLIPNKTSEIKIDSEKKLIIIKCMNCGNIYRNPYKGMK